MRIYQLSTIEKIWTLLTNINPFPANVSTMEKPGSWLLQAKCVKKHLWKSEILRKKMPLFHTYFSRILLVKTIHLVFQQVEHWPKMG